MYKTSKYNAFVTHRDTLFGCNLLTGAVIELANKKIVDILEKEDAAFDKNQFIDETQISEKDFKELKEVGFVISQDFDELAEIKFNYRRHLYNNSQVYVTVFPTLYCNFSCTYCCEDKSKPIKMSAETQANLIKWIKKIGKDKKRISINWFGGEPLLAKDVIGNISKRVKEYADLIGAVYSATLTTNGYLFNDNFINDIEKYRIKSVQITIDGDKKYHNLHRHLESGKGSFDVLYNNIVSFAQCKKTDQSLTIRINCTDDNYKSIYSLLKRFPKEIRKKIKIYFRWVYQSAHREHPVYASELKGARPYDKLHLLYTEAKKLGWNARNPNNVNKYGYCEVDFINYSVIKPDGTILLCNHDPSNSIGNVNNKKSVISHSAINRIQKWYSSEPFEYFSCLECKLLPECLGACRLKRYDSDRENCIEEKTSLEKYLINYIEQHSAMI